MKTKAFLLISALVLAACTTEQAGRNMRSQWVGKPADEFFVRFGPPHQNYSAADGRRIFLWEQTRMTTSGLVGCSAEIVADQRGQIADIRPREDSLGRWTTSRCAEIFS